MKKQDYLHSKILDFHYGLNSDSIEYQIAVATGVAAILNWKCEQLSGSKPLDSYLSWLISSPALSKFCVL